MYQLEKLNSLFSCQTSEEWRANLAALAKDFGFSQLFFGMIKDKNASFDSAFICTNYSQEWRTKYDQNGLHIIDPIVLHCARYIVPLIWKNDTFTGNKQNEFYEQACEYGLRSGISFPMHGPSGEFGIISFANAEIDQVLGFERLAALSLIRDFAFESSLKFMIKQGTSLPNIKLTTRELECLQWVMRGKTSWEASQILFCSEANINFHIANINKKFNVRTRQQAVLKAIKLKLIIPN